jgi:hypothetical protein
MGSNGRKFCANSVQTFSVCKSRAKPKCHPRICAKSVQKICAPFLLFPTRSDMGVAWIVRRVLATIYDKNKGRDSWHGMKDANL